MTLKASLSLLFACLVLGFSPPAPQDLSGRQQQESSARALLAKTKAEVLRARTSSGESRETPDARAVQGAVRSVRDIMSLSEKALLALVP